MQIKNLSLSFGMQEVFKEINLYIPNNEKIGIVGVNGAGKSTFFKVLTKKILPDNGKIILENDARAQLLPQVIDDEIPSMDINVFDFLLSARPIDELEKKLQNLYDKIGIETDLVKQDELFKKVNYIQKQLEYWEYYSADTALLKIISGMNINDTLLNQKLSDLSGGQKSKVAFARLLYSKPELILLDEPTNHLDKESKEYVINYLKNYSGGVFIISHDIDFLNQITTKILFLDKRTKKFELYNGNYNDFKKLHAEHEKEIIKQAEIQQEESNKLQNFIDKYSSASGKRKKMVKDREKKLEKLLENKIEVAPTLKKVTIDMNFNKESSNRPLKVQNLYFGYDENNIINNLNFEVRKGEKFLIIGKNGVGKSTLLKLIVGILKPKKGEILIGKNTEIGYYAQEHELLNNDKTIIENFDDLNLSINKLRGILGKFLFFDDDVFKMVDILSPGEKSRVALAKLSLIGANFLILDEPTNHLNPETQGIIADVFKNFKGTMLVVSHNPEFVDKLGIERTLTLPAGKIDYYDKKEVQKYEILNKKNK